MKLKSILTIIALFITACYTSSCSSDNIITSDETEHIIATAEVEFVDSIKEISIEPDSNGYVFRTANILDSVTFYKLYGKYMSTEDRIITEAIPNAPASRTGNDFNVTSKKNGNLYKVTISYGNLSVSYNTDYLYEFPLHTNDLTTEYHISYKPQANQYVGAVDVFRLNNFTLSVNIDLFNNIGDHKYDQTSTGICVKIDNQKFTLRDKW